MAAFGRWLLQERELRGLSREEVSRLGRLPPGVVETLESGDGDRMPPRAYVFAYLRSYATAAGLDPDDVVLRWQETVGPEERAAPRSRLPPPRTILAVAIAVALAVLVALVLVGPRSGPARLQLKRSSPPAERAGGAGTAPDR
jgi:cytoskeletal protein RodZ